MGKLAHVVFFLAAFTAIITNPTCVNAQEAGRERNCSDKKDNDGDGAVDCDDADCGSFYACGDAEDKPEAEKKPAPPAIPRANESPSGLAVALPGGNPHWQGGADGAVPPKGYARCATGTKPVIADTDRASRGWTHERQTTLNRNRAQALVAEGSDGSWFVARQQLERKPAAWCVENKDVLPEAKGAQLVASGPPTAPVTGGYRGWTPVFMPDGSSSDWDLHLGIFASPGLDSSSADQFGAYMGISWSGQMAVARLLGGYGWSSFGSGGFGMFTMGIRADEKLELGLGVIHRSSQQDDLGWTRAAGLGLVLNLTLHLGDFLEIHLPIAFVRESMWLQPDDPRGRWIAEGENVLHFLPMVGIHF